MIMGLSQQPNKIDGTNNADTIKGTEGSDHINALAGGDSIDGGMGNDSISAGLGNDTVNGGAGKDTILGGAGDDVIDGGEGDDLLRGQVGNDTILGGEGNDNISGGTENDLIEGGAGNDKLFGDEHDDTLVGGAGADRLDGGADNDLLIGGEGADYLKGGTGKDTFQFDLVKDNPTGAALNAKELDTIADFVSGEDKLNIQVDGKTIAPTSANFKTIDASIYKGAAPMLTALAAMPVEGTQFVYLYNLAGGGTSGYLVVLEGTPTGTVVKYAVQMLGATAADDLVIADFVQPDPVVVDPEDPVDPVEPTIKYNLITGTDATFEQLNGTDAADSIEALGGIDIVYAGKGDDIVNGGAGPDFLYGEEGNDFIDLGSNSGATRIENAFGGAGNDTIRGQNDAILFGNEGNDTLSGSSGSERITLAGGVGADTYLISGNEKSIEIKDSDQTPARNFERNSDNSLKTPIDTVVFGTDVKLADLVFTATFDDRFSPFDNADDPNMLVITSSKNPDFKLTVTGQFSEFVLPDEDLNDGYDFGYGGEGEGEVPGLPVDPMEERAIANRIEEFKFADGTKLSSDDVFALINKHSDFNDVLFGTDLGEKIEGLAGDDLLNGFGGDDELLGQLGDDSILGGDGNDLLNGGEGANFVSGGNGNDTINSFSGNDTLRGDNGNDTINLNANNYTQFADGGAGNDTFNLNGSNTRSDGSTGDDTYNMYGLGGNILDSRGGSDTYNVFALSNNPSRQAVSISDTESFPRFVFDPSTQTFVQQKISETDTIAFKTSNGFDIAQGNVQFSRPGQNGRDLLIEVQGDNNDLQLVFVNNFFDESKGYFGNKTNVIENFTFEFGNQLFVYSADDVVDAILNNDGYVDASLQPQDVFS